MKKLLAVLFLSLTVYGYCADDDSTNYSPIFLSSAGTNQKVVQPLLINYNYPGTGKRNCITDISFSGDFFPPVGQTFYILDGLNPGATAYQIGLTTGTVVEDWYPKNPLCLSNNTTTYVYISTGNFKLNVAGYEKGR